jgi:hypothetical protein
MTIQLLIFSTSLIFFSWKIINFISPSKN